MLWSWRTSISCLICLFGSLLSAQTPEEDVRSLFVHNGKLKWTRTLNGTVNNLHPVRMNLGYDGSAYRGFVTYDGVEMVFELQGAMRQGILTMQELDDEGNVTGIIKGNLGRDRFKGAWWSADMTRSAEVSLMDKGLILLDHFEPGFYVIEGTAGEEKIDIALSVESPLVISGTWQRNAECVRLLGECGDFLCEEMRLVVQDGDRAGEVIALSEENDGYLVKLTSASQPVHGRVSVSGQWPLIVYANAGYSYLSDMAYPAIREGAFHDWISSGLDKWYASAVRSVSSDEDHAPSVRWSKSASAWVDVFMMEDDLISGMITYFNSKDDSYSRETFIYDMRDKREISLSELEKHAGALLGKLRALIGPEHGSSEDFKYVMLSETGFVLCTDFDGITGDRLVCIPYEKVEDALRKRSLFAKLED